MKSFKATVLTKDKRLKPAPYRIPFQNKALQLISGGIIGGKFCEIAAESQCGKSFLAYELIAEVQKMGGYAFLNDGERAFEESYAEMMDIDIEGGTFAYSTEQDINIIFASWRKAITAVRKKKKKAPILLVQDSYPSLQTSMSIEAADKEKAIGYEAMQRNQAWSRVIEKLVDFLDENDATLVLINQFTNIQGASQYEFKFKSLCEEKMQFWATQRLRGTLKGKLGKIVKIEGNDVKIPTGAKTQWETIKNRAVKPFQKATVAIRYSKGMEELSGLYKLLLDTEVLVTFASKFLNGEADTNAKGEELTKAIKQAKLNPKKFGDETGFRLVNKAKKWIMTNEDLEKLMESHPSILEPIWTGTYDDGEDDELDVPTEEDQDGSPENGEE